MPNFWTNTYGLGGDPYASLRLTAQGSRLGIPLSGAGIEMQEIKLLNEFETLGKQEKAIDFAAELAKKTRVGNSFLAWAETLLALLVLHNEVPHGFTLVARPSVPTSVLEVIPGDLLQRSVDQKHDWVGDIFNIRTGVRVPEELHKIFHRL